MNDSNVCTPPVIVRPSFFGGSALIILPLSEGDISVRLRRGHVQEDSKGIGHFYFNEMVKGVNELKPESRRLRALFQEMQEECNHRRKLVRIDAMLSAAHAERTAITT